MEFMNKIPNEYICPITLDIMDDPVLCEDGHTYERKAIQQLTTSISPMTRQPIDKSRLITNRALKECIQKYRKDSKHKSRQISDIESDIELESETYYEHESDIESESDHEHVTYYEPKTKLDECIEAVIKGNLYELKIYHKSGFSWNKRICNNAAFYGHLNCLKYAHENGCPWDKYTTYNAASGGYLECLKYAHENGCPWDEQTCIEAAKNGHLNCLKYARNNRCPCNMEKIYDILNRWEISY